MAHNAPAVRNGSGPDDSIASGIEQLRIANQDVEGILRGFTGGEASITAAIGCIAGAGLAYIGIKAAERATAVVVPKAQQAIQELAIGAVL